jgi:hypothetical protein
MAIRELFLELASETAVIPISLELQKRKLRSRIEVEPDRVVITLILENDGLLTVAALCESLEGMGRGQR